MSMMIRLSNLLATIKAMARRNIGLYEARDDVDGRSLRRQHKMNADGAGHGGQSSQGWLQVPYPWWP
jgi:hypothetical protein